MANSGRHTIFVNDNSYQVDEDAMTGAQIKALDDVPAGNSLFLEVPGPDPDRKIDDSETIELRSGMKFYDLPPTIRGDDLTEELALLKEWYEAVETEQLSDGGTWVAVDVLLPVGWVPERTKIAALVPSGFPGSHPGGFFIVCPLTLPNGSQLGSQREHLGRGWTHVCWQVQNWDPGRGRLWRYFKAMERWFAEGWR